MWPFSEMSLASASFWGTVANFGLLASLVAGVVSTFVVVQTTDVKEYHWDEEKRRSSERISSNEKETERAIAESNKAIQRAAEAHRKTTEAELELFKLRSPRQLNSVEFRNALVGQPSWPIIEIWFVDASDCRFFAMDIASELSRAGWAPPFPQALQGANTESEFAAYQSPIESWGAQAIGVTVVAKTIGDSSPQAALMRALSNALPGWAVGGGRDTSMREETLRIVVAPRM